MRLFLGGGPWQCTPMLTAQQSGISSCLWGRDKGLRPAASPGALKVLFPLQDPSLPLPWVPQGSAAGGCCCMGAEPGPTTGRSPPEAPSHTRPRLRRAAREGLDFRLEENKCAQQAGERLSPERTV